MGKEVFPGRKEIAWEEVWKQRQESTSEKKSEAGVRNAETGDRVSKAESRERMEGEYMQSPTGH